MFEETMLCTTCWGLAPWRAVPLTSPTMILPPPRWSVLVPLERVSELKTSTNLEALWVTVGRPRMLGTKNPKLKRPSSLEKPPKGGGSGVPELSSWPLAW
jgi:hypothetical protein